MSSSNKKVFDDGLVSSGIMPSENLDEHDVTLRLYLLQSLLGNHQNLFSDFQSKIDKISETISVLNDDSKQKQGSEQLPQKLDGGDNILSICPPEISAPIQVKDYMKLKEIDLVNSIGSLTKDKILEKLMFDADEIQQKMAKIDNNQFDLSIDSNQEQILADMFKLHIDINDKTETLSRESDLLEKEIELELGNLLKSCNNGDNNDEASSLLWTQYIDLEMRNSGLEGMLNELDKRKVVFEELAQDVPKGKRDFEKLLNDRNRKLKELEISKANLESLLRFGENLLAEIQKLANQTSSKLIGELPNLCSELQSLTNENHDYLDRYRQQTNQISALQVDAAGLLENPLLLPLFIQKYKKELSDDVITSGTNPLNLMSKVKELNDEVELLEQQLSTQLQQIIDSFGDGGDDVTAVAMTTTSLDSIDKFVEKVNHQKQQLLALRQKVEVEGAAKLKETEEQLEIWWQQPAKLVVPFLKVDGKNYQQMSAELMAKSTDI